MENISPSLREDMLRNLINNNIKLDLRYYPTNENFTSNMLNYYRSGLNVMLQGDRSVHEVSAWLAQNPKINNFVKHPLTGDTIWHKYFRYTNVLLPPVYDRIPKSLMDTYGSSKDPILSLENFFGCRVFKLLRDDNERLRNKQPQLENPFLRIVSQQTFNHEAHHPTNTNTASVSDK